MEDWSFGYYDQHGERHGLGFGDNKPPAFFAATHHPTEKQIRYYTDTDLEQRYQQLAAVARELYKDLERVSDKRLERSKRENMLETHFNKLYDLGVEL